jgi:hypothetical protein
MLQWAWQESKHVFDWVVIRAFSRSQDCLSYATIPSPIRWRGKELKLQEGCAHLEVGALLV